jgi:endonuclease/exonuclease/phosphatase family metal-dependent hydrolase
MGRQLSLVQARIGGELILFGNVHLESMAEYSRVRVKQLTEIFKILQSEPTSILCGDFNYDANVANSPEEARIPPQWNDAADDKTQNTLGINYPYKKYAPGRFDRIIVRRATPSLLPLKQWQVFGQEVISVDAASSAAVPGWLLRHGPHLSDHLGVCGRWLLKAIPK